MSVSDLTPQKTGTSPWRFLVLAFLCASAAIAYVQRAAISVPAQEVANDLQFTQFAWQMGWVQSAWYWSYAFMQLPSGWLADRWGSRRTLAILTLLWSGATLLSGFATDFVSLLCLWALMGAAQAGAFPCAAKAIGESFPDSERARASGILASGMAIGGALAPILTGYLLKGLTPWAETLATDRWRLLLAVYALPGVVWTVLFLFVITPARLSYHKVDRIAVPMLSWMQLLRSRSLALLCAQQFFRAAGMVFFLTWFPTFLQKTRGVSLVDSGTLTSLAGIGAVLGSVSGGFFSDWLLRVTNNARVSRQGVAVVGLGLSGVLIVLSHFMSDVRLSIFLIAVGAFCATFGGVSGYTVAIRFGGQHVATVFSSMNMCGNIGAALFPVTAGWLVARTGNWNLILFMVAGIMAVDSLCWAMLNPRGTLVEEGDDAR